MSRPHSVKKAALHVAPVVRQAPLIPALVSVKPVRIVIEVEHGAVDAVHSSEPGVTVEILDHDAIAVGNVKAEDAAPMQAAIETMHQVY